MKFGKLTIVGVVSGTRPVIAECLCDCGTKKMIKQQNVTSGNTQSCGCIKRSGEPYKSKAPTTSGTPEYESWASAKQRCANPNAHGYDRYGGRGVVVCDRWVDSFENFIKDMGPRPHGFSLDRIDVNGGYSPANCRWATMAQQQNNKRTNVLATYQGLTKTLAEWAKYFGMNRANFHTKIKQGWTMEQIAVWRFQLAKAKNNKI